MIIKTIKGKDFRVSDPEKIKLFLEVFRDSKYPGDYQFLGSKNQVKKEEILSLVPEPNELPEPEKKESELFFTVRLDYSDSTQNVTINSKELPIALWGFLKETKVILGSSAFRGKDIISITPDKVSTMGWNKGYTPTPYENAMIEKTLGREMENVYSKIKELAYSATNLKELQGLATGVLSDVKNKLLLN